VELAGAEARGGRGMSVSNPTFYRALPWDDRRGTGGMTLFIVTEAALFVMLFFAYFYLGRDESRWPLDEPPKLKLSSIMLAVLLTSSVVLHLGEHLAKQGKHALARLAISATVALGVAFLVLQFFEYKDHLRTLLPTTDAYGSIFYTITSLHALHLMLGICMLAYVLVLPHLEHTDRSPYRALHNASLYWHFVDVVWIVIMTLLYYLPNVQRAWGAS
jgi:cytochrome c oxidase subunit III